MEIRDALSSQLLSTLTRPDTHPINELAYSPDGCSLACLSSGAFMIWDVQTGGVAKEIIRDGATHDASLTWSLDGEIIGTILWDKDTASNAVRVYNVASGTSSTPGTFQSDDGPYLWAHNTSFRVMATSQGDRDLTIEISEVGSVLMKIESFRISESWEGYDRIRAFSPTTYRISISGLGHNKIRVLDVRGSVCLFEQESSDVGPHCFSSDGILFAILWHKGLHVWKYTSGRYTPWREFPPQSSDSTNNLLLQFSPTSSSILGRPTDVSRVWHLDGPSTVAYPDSRTPLAVLSRCGTYIATCHRADSTITITNLHSQTPPRFIDAGMEVSTLALTGDILLAVEQKSPDTAPADLVAWRLRDGGIVDGIFADRRADRSDSIWTVSVTGYSRFSVEDQIVIIEQGRNIIHVYNMETGEVLEPTQAPPRLRGHKYSSWDMLYGRHYLHCRKLEAHSARSEDDWPVSRTTLEEGWVKDHEGKYRLWIPVEWRSSSPSPGWFSNITTLWFHLAVDGTVNIVMF